MHEMTPVFERFLDELTLLVSALDHHVHDLEHASDQATRAAYVADIARLSDALGALGDAFEAHDISALGTALTHASALRASDVESTPIPLPGAHDVVMYLRWRLRELRDIGEVGAADAVTRATIHRLVAALTSDSNSASRGATFDLDSALVGDDNLGALSETDHELLQAFSGAKLRARDEEADAQALREADARTPDGRTELVAAYQDTGPDSGMSHEDARRIFISETESDLQELSELIARTGLTPGERAPFGAMTHIGHKIKGSAATVGFPELSDIAFLFEQAVVAVGQSESTPLDFVRVTLGRFVDLFDACLASAAALEPPPPSAREEADQLCQAARRVAQAQATPGEALSALASGAASHLSSGRHRTNPRATATEGVLHVDSDRMDSLMVHLSALAVNRGSLVGAHRRVALAHREMGATIDRLQDKSARIVDTYPSLWRAAQARDSQILRSSGSFQKTRDEWIEADADRDAEVDAALRAMTEVVADVETHTTTLSGALLQMAQLIESQELLIANLQQDTTRMRLAPLADLAPRLDFLATWLAAAVGKQVRFTIAGEMTEIDGALMRALSDPLNQLVRNAIVHGIETPDERLAAGKHAVGSVWINAYYAGPDVVIEVGDDGRGVNAHALAARAVARGALSVEQARELTPDAMLRRMFEPGWSQVEHGGALAGSGIGLDEVATRIRELKGDIIIAETSPRGTVFQIHAPVTLTVIQSIEAHVGGQVFTLPFGSVVASMEGVSAMIQPAFKPSPDVHSVARDDGLTEYRLTFPGEPAVIWRGGARGDTALAVDGEVVAFSLAEALGLPLDEPPSAAVVIERRGRYVGLLVDRFGVMNETMVRPLPTHLRRKLIRGITVRAADGSVALLVDVGTLADQLLAGAAKAPPVRPPQRRQAKPVQRVLIVDDSVTIRRTVDQTLARAGFATAVARDGYEALEMMEAELPCVVILDVEMPRLGGYELLGIMRGSPRYAQTRVVMLTSRAGAAHEQQARALGADEYLVKPCPQDTLIDVVKRLLIESEPS
jgi:chemosensory pili system protein ChpA (sensor histidine kinase/response regulator)